MKARERHRLKEDKFAQTMIAAAAWVRDHRRPLLLACVGVAAVVAAVTWRIASRRNAELAAAEILAEVRTKARGVAWQDAAEKERGVRDVVSLCDMVAQNYPQTSAATLALFEAARTLAEAGQHKDAALYFRKTIERAGKLPGLARLARFGLAQSLEASGDVRAAIEEYSRLQSDPDSPGAAEAAWDLGRCYETLGDLAEAREQYGRAVERGRGTAWADLAAFRLQSLAASETASDAPGSDPEKQTAPAPPGREDHDEQHESG